MLEPSMLSQHPTFQYPPFSQLLDIEMVNGALEFRIIFAT